MFWTNLNRENLILANFGEVHLNLGKKSKILVGNYLPPYAGIPKSTYISKWCIRAGTQVLAKKGCGENLQPIVHGYEMSQAKLESSKCKRKLTTVSSHHMLFKILPALTMVGIVCLYNSHDGQNLLQNRWSIIVLETVVSTSLLFPVYLRRT